MHCPTVYADFQNADVRARVRLNCAGTRNDLEKHKLLLHPGLRLRLCDGESISADGIVEWDEIEGWVAVVDWSRLELDELSFSSTIIKPNKASAT